MSRDAEADLKLFRYANEIHGGGSTSIGAVGAHWINESLRLKRRVEELSDALGLALGAMEGADFSNGVTDPTGTIDEGVVRFCELRDQLHAALSPQETP